jgi:predicted ribosome quality control (RQC) complex YloA/Tae2 family protein
VNYDALTTGAICHELRASILGGRVQHVHHPDETSIALDVYAQGRSHWLYCSIHPDQARLHLTTGRPARTTDAVTPLLLLMRKYVDGGRVDDVYQPALERVIRLRFSRRAPSGSVWHTELIAEVMGRLSNLILVDSDGSVMDALKRVPPSMNRVRTVLPRRRYDPPPPPDKLDPRQVRAAQLTTTAPDGKPYRSLRDALIAQVNACSPLLAREVLYRAHRRLEVSSEDADWDAIAAAFHEIWGDAGAGRWGPTVALEEGKLAAYAAYPLRSFPEVRPIASMSAAVERWYAEGGATRSRANQGASPASGINGRLAGVAAVGMNEAQRRSLRQAIEAAQDRLRAKLYSLKQSMANAEEMDRLRGAGEYLLTVASQVPPGTLEVVPPAGATLTLLPGESAVEAAQRYFGRYAKAKAAAQEVPALIAGVEHEARYLDEALTHLDLARTPQELNDLRSEWIELGYVRAKRPGAKGKGRDARAKRAAPTGFRRVSVDGFDVLVGRSGKGNDVLLSREAHPADVWLHARGVPGAHVVVRAGGRDVPEQVLRRAAKLAAAHSQARTAPTVGVDYTLCKYVDRIKGAPPGLVNYRGERTIYVQPEAE